MAKFTITTPVNKCPLWLVSLLAFFPFDTKIEYPDEDKGSMLSAVIEYLRGFTYTRRNNTEHLGTTHSIERTDNTITVKTVNFTTYLTIQLK